MPPNPDLLLPAVALRSPQPGIELLLYDLDDFRGETSELRHTLSPAEQERAARFGSDGLRRRWMVGRAKLRRLLGRRLGLDPARVPLRRGVRGRPELDMPQAPDFNLSHTENVALLAVGTAPRRGQRIGVDIERADRSVRADRLAGRVLTDRERAALAQFDAEARRLRFLRLWTCKEAMSKATGDALSAPFRRIDIALDDEMKLAAGPAPYLPERWQLFAAAAPEDFIATIAVWNGD